MSKTVGQKVFTLYKNLELRDHAKNQADLFIYVSFLFFYQNWSII